jgi:hypothetical protein
MGEVFQMHCHDNCNICTHDKYKTAKGRKKCSTYKERGRIVQKSIYRMRKAYKAKRLRAEGE